MAKRIQLSRAKGWRKPEGAVVVARPTFWGNPAKVGKDGSHEDCIRIFRAFAETWVSTRPGWIDRVRRELRGRDLCCWCPLDQPCHADVLLELANAPEAP